MIAAKTFRYRLEPTTVQATLFAQFAGCARYVFNRGLAERIFAFDDGDKPLSFVDQCNALPTVKKAEGTAWLRVVDSQVLQQALKDLDRAYRHFFRRIKTGQVPGFPRFKKKGENDAFRFPQRVKAEGGKVFLPKIGWVRYRDSRPVEGTIKQATVKREGQHWFVCLACEVEIADFALPAVIEERSIGIDVGLKSFAVLSDGTEIANPRFLAEQLKRLKYAQRALSRKVKGSANRKKQIVKVAKLHTDVKNARKDFTHKLSTEIVKNHDVICVEDLNIEGMVKNRCLSRAISDVGWGGFLAMLEYKAKWFGKHFVKVGRFLATTKTCSACGAKKPIPLGVRTYSCGDCGLVLDRDLNASLNIRAAGLAVLACGGI